MNLFDLNFKINWGLIGVRINIPGSVLRCQKKNFLGN